MFGKNNIANMPDFVKDYDLWDRYMGNVWAKLLAFLKINRKSSVIDLASGTSAKIEYGLAKTDFCGTLYLVEPQPDVARVIFQKAQTILPKANVILLNEKINSVKINSHIDAIFANHPFDDFLSACLAQKKDFNAIFEDISKEELSVLDLLKQSWEKPSQDLERAKSEVKRDFEEFVNRHNPEIMIFSQYPSSYFENNNLSIINSYAAALFKEIFSDKSGLVSVEKIQKIMDENENYGNAVIGENILDARNWVVYAK